MKSRGFTILEVMLALAILVALLAVMSSVLGGVAQSRQSAGERTARDQGITAAFELLSSAIDTCVADDGRGGSGVEGELLNLRLVASRVPARRLEPGAFTGSPLADRDAIEFSLDGRNLVLRDVDGRRSSVLVQDVVAIRFRYHDGEAWRDAWNSAESGFPRAVELAVWTTAWPEGDLPAWMPEEEFVDEEPVDTDLADEMFDLDAEAEPDELEAFSGMAMDTDDPLLPEPDRRCVVAVFNPVSLEAGTGFEVADEEVELP